MRNNCGLFYNKIFYNYFDIFKIKHEINYTINFMFNYIANIYKVISRWIEFTWRKIQNFKKGTQQVICRNKMINLQAKDNQSKSKPNLIAA